MAYPSGVTQDLIEQPNINGFFDVWSAGTSFTTAVGTAIGWIATTLGTSGAATISQQTFSTRASQTAVAGFPTYFHRWNQTTLASTSPILQSRIEDVTTFAGQRVTLEFYAQTNQIIPTVQLRQFFGTGGSPSADVVVSAPSLINSIPVSTTFQRYAISFDVPAIAAKVIGSAAVTSYLAIEFLLPTGTIFQFDLAAVKLVAGELPVATGRRRPAWREKEYTKRYYDTYATWACVSTQSANFTLHRVEMMKAPSITSTGATSSVVTADGYALVSTGAAAAVTIIADARL